MLWIVAFNDVGLKWLVNGTDTDLHGLTYSDRTERLSLESTEAAVAHQKSLNCPYRALEEHFYCLAKYPFAIDCFLRPFSASDDVETTVR